MDEKELYRLVLSKCHRCPIRDMVGELKNPSNVYVEEYIRIRDEVLKSEKLKQKPLLLKRIKNVFKN